MDKQPSEVHVGLRIRFLRQQRKLSLRALSERSGLSINAISQIERDEVSPTVSSLNRLADAFEVHITDLFEIEKPSTTLYVKSRDRESLQEDGVMIESLGFGLRHQQFEPFRMTIRPGARVLKTPLTHKGHEFIYCLEGELEYFIEDEKFHLEAGDSLLFEAHQPHHWRNLSNDQSAVLLVFQMAQSLQFARQTRRRRDENKLTKEYTN